MVAIISMGMIVYPAKTKVQDMGRYNKKHSWYQQPRFVENKKLFNYKQNNTQGKQDKG